jgi:PKD repeat protein
MNSSKGILPGPITVLLVVAAAITGDTRIYWIGNSVTDAVNYSTWKQSAEAAGEAVTWGRHMIPGAPIEWIWDHPDGGISEEPYGKYQNALKNYVWDFVSLQPYDRGLTDDIDDAGKFMEYTSRKSPDVQFLIFSHYPRVDNIHNSGGYQKHWDSGLSVNGGFETRKHYEELALALRQNFPAMKPVLIVPIGEVYYELDKKMRAGEIPGKPDVVSACYADGIHQNKFGNYIVGCSYFATIFKSNPSVFSGSRYGVSGTAERVVQQTVWDVVRYYRDPGGVPWSGVGEASHVAVTSVGLSIDSVELVPGQSIDLVAAVLPANASDKTVVYSSGNGSVATVSAAGTVTGVGAGTAELQVKTNDGNYTDVCTVRVTASGMAVTGVSVSPQTTAVNAGHTVQLTVTVSPADATNKNVIWSAAAPSVATVDNSGTVAGVSKGITTIIARTVNGGFSAASAVTVTIDNTPPVAAFSATPQSGYAPLTVRFDGSASYDNDEGDFVLGYDWNFGDGSFAYSNAPAHVYPRPGTYTVTLVAMDSNNMRGDTAFDTITVNLMSGQPLLLSVNKPATASSFEHNSIMGTFPPVHVNDGDTATRWASNATDNEWIQIELETACSFDRIVLHWEAAFGRQYTIQTSENGQAWTDIFTETNGDGGVDIIDASGRGRYVRMQGLERATDWGYSLYEFEIYRLPAATSPIRLNASACVNRSLKVGSQRVYDLRGRLIMDFTCTGRSIMAHGGYIHNSGQMYYKRVNINKNR